MRRVLFEIGPLPVQTFGFMIALGILAGLWLAVREARRKGLDENKLFDFVIIAIIAGVVGGRLGYVFIYDPGRYLANPLELFYIHQGGMSIHGTIVAAILAALWWCRKEKLSFWRLSDTLVPSLILGQAIGRVGCDVFGKVMTSPYPWGVTVGSSLLHPTQVYEFLLDYLLFFIIWRKRTSPAYEGQIFIYYLIGFNLNRGIVEFFRINPLVAGQFTAGHIASLLFILLGLGLVWFRRKGRPLEPTAELASSRENGSSGNFWQDLIGVLGLVIVSLLLYYGLPPQ